MAFDVVALATTGARVADLEDYVLAHMMLDTCSPEDHPGAFKAAIAATRAAQRKCRAWTTIVAPKATRQ